ncbi:hypothetical protein RS81_02044 [Microbacterium terrae]|uniref:Uncharacterized protein n=1 Tax=Microbacterium terrae TaxID=69369 RepID=A0A0M2H5X9_9MICO|nr:hypothetical protein RS81_02044 [Microbacterium terrae]
MLLPSRPASEPVRVQSARSPYSGSDVSVPPGTAYDRTSRIMVVRSIPRLGLRHASVYWLRFQPGTALAMVSVDVTVLASASHETSSFVLR